MEIGTKNCKHLFLDIVGYSKNRTVEAQSDIISKLNEIIKKVLIENKVAASKRLLLPTGDGMCITFINNQQYDFAIVIAVAILKELKFYNDKTTDNMRKIEIRIGINENIDNIIIDINNKKNIAGSGINYAQRIMSLADGNMIMIGSSVYEQVNKRDKYYGKFRAWNAIIKHNERLPVYQYIDENISVLNTQIPVIFQQIEKPKIEINLTDHLSMYLAIVYKGVDIYGPLKKDIFDTEYLVITLYQLADFVQSFFSNSKNIVKDYASEFGGTIVNDGRCILITKAIQKIKESINYPIFCTDLSKYYTNVLIEKNYASNLFVDSSEPIELSDEGKLFVEEHCKEELEFIQEIK